MTIKGNKGEWSEFYTFVKLLADGKIYAADKDLNKNESIFYLILKIIRGEQEDLDYVRGKTISIQKGDGTLISDVPIDTLLEYSKRLYSGILEGKTKDDEFQIEANDFFETLKTNSLSDERNETADIRIIIHDPITQHEPLLGFSIKSYIGSKPTLFNSSKQSNFIYRVTPELTKQEIVSLNEMDTYGNRIQWLKDNNYELNFVKLQSDIFKSNLELIDSKLPEILASLLLHNFFEGVNTITDLTTYLNGANPCNFNIELNPNFYDYKIKRLLVDSALGMKAGKLWTGTFNANGGYIAVKRDGELLCYHIYNWNEFQEYLVSHTKIDHPDSKPKRCDYGRILEGKEIELEEGVYMKLNFQIRFR